MRRKVKYRVRTNDLDVFRAVSYSLLHDGWMLDTLIRSNVKFDFIFARRVAI